MENLLDDPYSEVISQKAVRFESQNVETGFFDVSFKVDGKIIHAHKFVLAASSKYFENLFMQEIKTNKPIIIENYSFNDFFQLLTFLYSGKCDLNDEDIFAIIDMAVKYEISVILKNCDNYLSLLKYSVDDVIKYYNSLSNIENSLPKFNEKIQTEFTEIYPDLLDSVEIVSAKKETIEAIVKVDREYKYEAKLFQMVIKWAEHQAHNKHGDSDFCFNEEIKNQLHSILPYIRFNAMDEEFVKTFVVKHGFLFSYDKLSEILVNMKKFKVEITDVNGKKMYGVMYDQNFIVDEIKAIQGISSDSVASGCHWNIKNLNPYHSSQNVPKNKDCYYLQVGCVTGNLFIHPSITVTQKGTNILLAELAKVDGFVLVGCKICIV